MAVALSLQRRLSEMVVSYSTGVKKHFGLIPSEVTSTKLGRMSSHLISDGRLLSSGGSLALRGAWLSLTLLGTPVDGAKFTFNYGTTCRGFRL